MALTITDANAQQVLNDNKLVMIDFWGTHCGPCIGMAPIVDELAEKYAGQVMIGKYNVEEENDLAVECRVMAVPTFLFFKDGVKTKIKAVGSMTKDKLEDKIKELMAL